MVNTWIVHKDAHFDYSAKLKSKDDDENMASEHKHLDIGKDELLVKLKKKIAALEHEKPTITGQDQSSLKENKGAPLP